MLFSRKRPERRSDPPPETPSPEAAAPLEHPLVQRAERPGYGDPEARPQSYIDASLTIVGDLHAEGDVRLDGRICGNLNCAQLIVGRDAAITGAVTAEQAIVRGRVTGTIRAPVVILQNTAHVESEITYGQLAIDDGAIFEGTAHRSDNPLHEVVAASMEELQRMMRAAETAAMSQGGAKAAGARGNGAGSPESAATAAPDALPAPAVNGAANGHGSEREQAASPRT
jgi:cytoskeletal protein CcmA (bactofilin family)